MHLGFSSMNTAEDPAPDLLARTLEEAGFESLWYGEHSHIPVSRLTPPGRRRAARAVSQDDGPPTSLMAAAAVTSRLKLGTGIALLLNGSCFPGEDYRHSGSPVQRSPADRLRCRLERGGVHQCHPAALAPALPAMRGDRAGPAGPVHRRRTRIPR